MLLIFDLDGTLFQAKPVVERAGLDTGIPGYRERLLKAICEHGALFPGVHKLLGNLHSAGFKLVICSKSPMEYIGLVVEQMGISRFFEGYYSAEGYSSKADLVKEIISPGIPAAVIGDTHGDITAAIENGLPSIAAMYGYGNKSLLKDADYFVDSPEEIAECLKRIS